MGFVGRAFAEQGVDDGSAELLREGDDRLAGVGDHGAVADVEQRPLRVAQVLGRTGDGVGVGRGEPML